MLNYAQLLITIIGKMTNKNPSNKGKTTRQHILETAAELFAQKGYAYTTSKEICHASNANIAAVNYHFGSKDGLYNEVLLAMHDRLITLDALNDIAHGQLAAKEKLIAVFDELMKNIIERKWHARMFIREMLSPSPALDTLLTKRVLPKFKLIKEIISELTGIPSNDPAINYCLINVIGPSAALLIADEKLLNNLLPDLSKNSAYLTQHLTIFSLAGLEAIATHYHQHK